MTPRSFKFPPASSLFWVGMVMFGLAFALISLVNHHLFRTYALDLGMMNHALHSFSEFNANTFTLGLTEADEKPFLGTHFSPVMFLYVPVYWLLGNSSLLFIQIAAMLLGGIGVFRAAKGAGLGDRLSMWAGFHFFAIWGIYSALEFDFHNNVSGAMLVPWLWHFLAQRRKVSAALVLTIILACQENMGLWMVFFLLGFLLNERSLFKRESLRFEWPLIFFSALYFGLALGWIMPTIAGETHSSQLSRYSEWGVGGWDIARNMLSHPLQVMQHLFTCDHPDAPAKVEFHWMMMIAGGWACLRHPQFLCMLIPIYAQKMLSNAPSFWGVGRQYSIEFVPIISLAVVFLASKHRRLFQAIYPLLFVVTLGSTIVKFKERKDFFKRECIDLFYAPHYETHLDLAVVRDVLSNIPDDISLSVSSSLAPHLANRPILRLFPQEQGADMIVLVNDPGNEWPLTETQFQDHIARLKASDRHILVEETADLWVFQVLP